MGVGDFKIACMEMTHDLSGYRPGIRLTRTSGVFPTVEDALRTDLTFVSDPG